MATAIIEINGQVGSVTNLPLGVDVNLNDAGAGASTRLWALLSAPPGSAAWIQNPTTKTPTLKTVDSVGSYRLRLTVNGSVTDIAIAAVRTANLNIRIPATGEEDEYGSTIGWSKAMYDAFVAIDADSILGNTLDESYDEGGAGAGRSIIADSGAVLIDASGDEALDLDGYITLNEISDPATLANAGLLYTKDDGGTTELFYRDSDGNIRQLTPASGSNNTLDQAYDQGGAGAGRSITADSGAVQVDASGDMALDLDGYISLSETSDPTNITDQGFVYAKDVFGITELFYMDDAGTVTQITSDGYLDTFESLRGVGLFEQSADPTPAVDKGYVFTKDVGGTTALMYMDDGGSLSRLDGYIGVGNTLDQAYDQGGAGVGRTIVADSGEVVIDASGANALELNGCLTLDETSDPGALADAGLMYTKDVSGNTELFYRDSDGNVIQITSDGYLGIDGYTVLEQFDELDPAATTGTETFLPLTGIPMVQSNMPSGYALDVFQNGARMRWVAALGVDKTEWTYNPTLSRVEFVASGVAGTWYAARYQTDPQIAIHSLDQAYDAGRVITADAGAVVINASGDEALEIDGYLTLDEISNPSNLANAGLVYSSEIDGYTELYYMDDFGLATQITNKGSPVGGGGNTLDQAYDKGGAGAGRIITANAGAVVVDASGDEAIDIDGYLTLAEIAAPTGLPNEGHIYAKDDGGDTELFYQDASGNEVQITQDGSTLGANTLNQAYDQGGPGAGRTITTDAGPVFMDAAGDDALELDGYMLLNEIIDPTNITNKGFLYAKNDDAYGTSELFYMDDSGQVTQITQDGYLATYNSLRGASLLEGTEFTGQVGSISLYAKLSNGITELFTKDSSGNETQVTLGGRLNTTAVTNSGFADAVVEFIPSVAVDLTSTSFVDITGADGYFDAIVAGSYILTFNAQVHQDSGVSQRTNFRVIVDKGDYNGFTEQVIEPINNDAWNIVSAGVGEHYSASFTTQMVELGFGNHKITVQYQNDGGGAGAQIDTNDYVNLVAINLAGSGAGGAISDQAMLLVGKNYVSVDTWETVTEINVSFDTVENEEVLLVYSGSISTTGVVNAYTSFAVDGYRYQDGVREGLSQAKDISKSYVTPPLTAGNHTASFQVSKDGAGTLTVDAYGTLQVLQFRGGLVPIRDEGIDIIDVPAALNFTGRVVVTDNDGVADIQIGDINYIKIEQQVADATPNAIDGYVYGKLIDGYTELFYMDNYGIAIRLTQDGNLAEHASSHIFGASDEIDGDKLDIDWSPSNYTPTTAPAEVTSVNELTAHLAGIDGYLLDLGNDIASDASDLAAHEADTANPHTTDIENLGSGTLAELNDALTDATLGDISLLDAYATDAEVALKADLTLLDGYLELGGGDAMAGNLDMGGNDITNVVNVDGYDLPAQFQGIENDDAYQQGQLTTINTNLITHKGNAANPHSVSLDQAYDEGGSGAGRLIIADAGSVQIDASGDEALELDGYITLNEISDPTGLADSGIVYTKDIDGYSELHHVDNFDESVQITRRGALYNLLPSYVKAQLPSASPAGQMVFVTDEAGGSVPAFSDGLNWRRITDRNIVS